LRGEGDGCDVGDGEVDLLCLCLHVENGNRIDPHDGHERALCVELEELDVRSLGRGEREEGKESNEEQGGSASGKRGGRGRETDPEARP